MNDTATQATQTVQVTTARDRRRAARKRRNAWAMLVIMAWIFIFALTQGDVAVAICTLIAAVLAVPSCFASSRS